MWELTNIEERDGFTHEESGKKLPAHLYFYAKSLDDEGIVQTMVMKEMFAGGYNDIHWGTKKFFDEFDFGYCVTCHKSQGSQWNNVAVYDESYVFQEDQFKWLYTAVTRAAEKLTIIGE
jgi:exodeoxyribonuclease-5